MGCAVSALNRGYDSEAVKRSSEIDRMLSEQAKRSAYEAKLLLLDLFPHIFKKNPGAGESGKSTIMKHLRIIHQNGFTRKECLDYKPVIFNNTIQSMTSILRAMNRLHIKFSQPRSSEDARELVCFAGQTDSDINVSQSLVSLLKRLWNDQGVQECFRRSREYQLTDSAAYYLSSMDQLLDPDYLPTEQDILRTRVKSCGVVELDFMYGNLHIRLLDVGGQRTERKKWIHCFDGVTAVIFTVAMSEYDLTLLEDENMNRMTESLKLFDSICNNSWFKNASMILFLNKKDQFEEKIKWSPFSIGFPEYTGANTYAETAEYMRLKFESLSQSKRVYSQYTCATDRVNIEFVFKVTTDDIISTNLLQCGII